ncbi:MAG: STAS domain-containing protein [Burkholderiales bacterium]
MEVTAVRYADVLVVAARGRIDYTNAEDFKAALLPHLEHCAAGRDQVVLDLSRLEYVSSAGLRVLMISAKEVRARKGRLVAVALQPVVREIFEISRFTLVFDIFDSVPDALRALSPKAASMSHTG